MGWKYEQVHEQTCAAYKKVDYGGNSIYNSGCGPSSLANALLVLGLANITVKQACDFALACDARIKGQGTSMSILLRAAAKKYGFVYKTTSSNKELAAHLRSGGVAIMNQGSAYGVFANGGHYVMAASIDSQDRVTVLDSFWNDKKYKTWPEYGRKSKILARCVVRTPLYYCGLGTTGRNPSYYLLSKKTVKQDKPTLAKKEEYTVKQLTLKVNESKQVIDAIEKDGHNYVRLDQLPKLLPVSVGYKDKTPTLDAATIPLCIDGKNIVVPGGIMAPGKSFAAVADLLHELGYSVAWEPKTAVVVAEKKAGGE